MCAEAGEDGMKETAVRIVRQKKIDLDYMDNIIETEEFWKFANVVDQGKFRRWLKEYEIKLVILDPTYFGTSAEFQSNQSGQGQELKIVMELCKETKTTLIFVAHTKKMTLETYEPLKLNDITGAAGGSFARQWILLSNRLPYLDDGEHYLWMRISGSKGQGGVWGLDISEGKLNPDSRDGGRHWTPTLLTPAEAREQDENLKKAMKANRHASKLDKAMEEVAKMMPEAGDTKSGLLNRVSCGRTSLDRALEELKKRGMVEKTTVRAANRDCEGIRLTEEGKTWRKLLQQDDTPC